MAGLQSIDIALFRSINLGLQHPFLDLVLPFFSDNPFFLPAAVGLGLFLIWKGGTQGRLFILFIVLITAIGDGVICKSLKQAINRPRPPAVVEDARRLVGRGRSGSMPSSHAANWFAAATVLWFFYRKWMPVALILALVISFSRVYLGAHFVSDVAAGAILGLGYALGILLLSERVWHFAGPRWFHRAWNCRPVLLQQTPTHPPSIPTPA